MKWSFLPPDESEYDQSSITNRQFAGNRGSDEHVTQHHGMHSAKCRL